MKEHLYCRSDAVFFDVSHMGQVRISGRDHAAFIERVTVLDYKSLSECKGSLSLILNERGGVIDDTVITRFNDHAYMVINGACKHRDLEHMRRVQHNDFAGKDVKIDYSEDNALIALQGPKAFSVLETIIPSLNTKGTFWLKI